MGALLADAFRGVRCDLAFLEVVEDDRAVLQFVRRGVDFAFGACQFIVRLRFIDALSLDAWFNCRFAVCASCAYYGGLVDLAAKACAYVDRRLIRAGQLV